MAILSSRAALGFSLFKRSLSEEKVSGTGARKRSAHKPAIGFHTGFKIGSEAYSDRLFRNGQHVQSHDEDSPAQSDTQSGSPVPFDVKNQEESC